MSAFSDLKSAGRREARQILLPRSHTHTDYKLPASKDNATAGTGSEARPLISGKRAVRVGLIDRRGVAERLDSMALVGSIGGEAREGLTYEYYYVCRTGRQNRAAGTGLLGAAH